MENKRQHKRVPSEFLVRIKIPETGETREGKSVNLSHGGTFVRSSAPLPRGTMLRIELHLEPVKETVQVDALVVWTRPKMPDPKFPPGMGLKFVDLDDKTRRIIETTVEMLASDNRERQGGSDS